MINVTEATMKELVEFYNAHAEKPVKRFADRKTAMRRVDELIADMEAGEPEVFTTNEQLEHARDLKRRGELDNGPAPQRSVTTRSAGIAESWKVAETRRKRCQRSAVEVDGVEYRSVRQAFAALGLPMKMHIAFRMELKATGKAAAFGHEWEIIPLNY